MSIASRRTVSLGLVAVLATALGGLGAGSALASVPVHQVQLAGTSAHPSAGRGVPSPAARGVGIAARGQAYMGWSLHRSAPVTAPGLVAFPPPQHPKLPGGPVPSAQKKVYGVDVSAYQGAVNWLSARAAGKSFAYVKASEGTYYTNPYYSQQFGGSALAGLIRGAYHFANPANSDGATQARYFVAHGGAWRPDGLTLPGVLDIEYNPYGSECYGLSQPAMVSWITSFVTTYSALTNRKPVIYSTTDWWTTCTGNTATLAPLSRLWIARWSSVPGTLPSGWSTFDFWQYSGSQPVDQDRFRLDIAALRALASG